MTFFGQDRTNIDVLTTPYQAPKANVPKVRAICERFLGSVRRECLDFFLILNERLLYKTVKQYQAYLNHARPHQGISQRIPDPLEQQEEQNVGRIMAHPVLGGLHHDYRRRTPGESTLLRAACISVKGFPPQPGAPLCDTTELLSHQLQAE